MKNKRNQTRERTFLGHPIQQSMITHLDPRKHGVNSNPQIEKTRMLRNETKMMKGGEAAGLVTQLFLLFIQN